MRFSSSWSKMHKTFSNPLVEQRATYPALAPKWGMTTTVKCKMAFPNAFATPIWMYEVRCTMNKVDIWMISGYRLQVKWMIVV